MIPASRRRRGIPITTVSRASSPCFAMRARSPVNVTGAKRNRQRAPKERDRETLGAPISESRRFASDSEAGDHLASGVEKESQEVTIRNGISLPTAVELIAKINIHYCNYFLRRGRAESHDLGPRELRRGSEAEGVGNDGTRKGDEQWQDTGERRRTEPGHLLLYL